MDNDVMLPALCGQIIEKLKSMGFGKYSLQNYYYEGFKPIMDACRLLGIETYQPEIVSHVVKDIVADACAGKIARSKAHKSKKAEFLMKEFCETGQITWRRMRKEPDRPLEGAYGQTLASFEGYMTSLMRLTPQRNKDPYGHRPVFFPVPM